MRTRSGLGLHELFEGPMIPERLEVHVAEDSGAVRGALGIRADTIVAIAGPPAERKSNWNSDRRSPGHGHGADIPSSLLCFAEAMKYREQGYSCSSLIIRRALRLSGSSSRTLRNSLRARSFFPRMV